jgi:hypothetical protein
MIANREASAEPRVRTVAGVGKVIAADLICGRADWHYSDWLVYEELSSELLDNQWHMV